MKLIRITSMSILIVVITHVSANEGRQSELDQACEVAREEKIAPLRKQYIEDCVTNEKKERAYCEKYYSDYGDRAGNRAPLFYDLPECVEAFEYRQRYRRAN